MRTLDESINYEMAFHTSYVMAIGIATVLAIDWKLHIAGGLMDKHDRRSNFFSYWINRFD